MLTSGAGVVYFLFVATTANHISGVLSNMSYIGPLREYPKRFYESTEEIPQAVGVRGELTPHILRLTTDKQVIAKTNEWLERFGLARRISYEPFHGDLFALNVTDLERQSTVDFSDSGFGLSQLLPLIVQGFHSKSRAILFLEQPEIHLNPKLQSELANLFAAISVDKKVVIVETHSEHLVLRIRTLIAEKKLRAEDVALYYIEKKKGSSILRRIPISHDGHIEPNEWPTGFFADAISESLNLASAQSGQKS